MQRLLIVQNRDQDELNKLREHEKTQNQQKTNLEQQVWKLTEEAAMQEGKIIKLQQNQQQDKEELTHYVRRTTSYAHH